MILFFQFQGHSSENAMFMLLDGTNFKLFDRMLDSGAPGGPQMDGVFSMALGNVVNYGIYYIYL